MSAPIDIPSFFSYARSISPSEALLSGVTPDGSIIPVQVMEKGIRGTIGTYTSVYDDDGRPRSEDNVAKLHDPENANLQRIDVAFLPHEADRLHMAFSVVIQANALAPGGCNDHEFRARIARVSERYADLGGFDFLGQRYAWNLVNCRPLWRNRFALDKKVEIADPRSDDSWTFDADNIPLDRFPGNDALPDGVSEIAARIGASLSGRSSSLFLDVRITGRVPPGLEVFPSQEYIGDGKTTHGKDKPSRVLSSVRRDFGGEIVRQATIHSQKIGNALRTIDEWHGQEHLYGAIPVEPFGNLQSHHLALRQPKTGIPDVYSLLLRLDRIEQALRKSDVASDLPGDVHYLMAVLVRGGVFSGTKKKTPMKETKRKKSR